MIVERWWHAARLHRSYQSGIPRPSHLLLHSKVLIGGVVVSAVVLGGLAANAHDTLLSVDEPVSEWVRDQQWLVRWRWLSDLGSEQQGIVLAVVLGVALWPWCRVFAVAYPAAVAAGSLVNVTLKYIVDRPRPPDPDAGTALASFPSGHALHAVIIWGLLPPAIYVLSRRRWAFWAAVVVGAVAIAGVGLQRVHLGAHWPTDVVGSMLVGAVILLAAEYAITIEDRHGHREGCALHARLPEGVPGPLTTEPDERDAIEVVAPSDDDAAEVMAGAREPERGPGPGPGPVS
jgi:hypothetical protein